MHITPIGGIILAIVILGPLAFFLFRHYRQGNMTFKLSKTDQKEPENTMILDASKGISFTNETHDDMLPMTCRNNGRDYYVVRKEDKANSQLEVPDTCGYYDPGEYANVLTMKAHADLFERRRTLFQNIAPWALVVCVLIVGIILIVLAG